MVYGIWYMDVDVNLKCEAHVPGSRVPPGSRFLDLCLRLGEFQ